MCVKKSPYLEVKWLWGQVSLGSKYNNYSCWSTWYLSAYQWNYHYGCCCMDWCCQYGPNCLFKVGLCWITYEVDYLKQNMDHAECLLLIYVQFPMESLLNNVPVTSTTQFYISGRPLGSGWTAALTLKSKMKHEKWIMQIERYPLVVKTFVQ